jgi:hypothetical protein
MCGPLFLTVASFGLLSVGACLGFLTAALFAAGAEPADLPKPKKVVSIPDDSAEMVSQAAASLYALGACLREGQNPSGAMADASRALHRVADRFPELLPSGLVAGGICDKYDYDGSFRSGRLRHWD